MNRKLDILRQVDRRQALRVVVFKVKGAGLYKIKVKGNVQLRPRLCFGPLAEMEVVTLLQRVEKKGGQESPPGEESATRSLNKIREIIASPQLRRTEITG